MKLKTLLIFTTISILFVLTGCVVELPIGRGYLTIDSYPQGANILINDKLVGQTPYRVQFSWVGGQGWQVSVLSEGSMMGKDVEINPEMKVVLIKEGYFREERMISKIKDVILEQGGDRRQDIPVKVRVMFYLTSSSPVSSTGTSSTPPIAPQQQQQMMGPTIVIGGKTVTGDDAIEIVNYGMVMFDSTPQGAEVLIEGNLIGYTPTSHLKFEVGTYNVEIVKTGYQSWERKIMVIQDSSIVISPELEKR